MKAFFLSCKLPLEAKSQTRECWPKLSLEECLFCSWQLTVVTKCLCNSFVIWGLGALPVICRVGYGQGLRGPGFNSGSLLPFIKRTCRPKICSVSVCSEKEVLQRISAHIFLMKNFDEILLTLFISRFKVSRGPHFWTESQIFSKIEKDLVWSQIFQNFIHANAHKKTFCLILKFRNLIKRRKKVWARLFGFRQQHFRAGGSYYKQ